MTIFYRHKISDLLSNEKDCLTGPANLLDEDGFLLFPCFRLFCSLVTPHMISVLSFLVFAYAQYRLPSEVYDDCGGLSRKGIWQFRRCFSSSTTSDCYFRLLLMNFVTGRTDQEYVNAHLPNTSMNVDDCDQLSLLQSKTSLSAPICDISIRFRSTKWSGAVLTTSFAHLKPMWIVSEHTFFVSTGTTFTTLLEWIHLAFPWAVCCTIVSTSAFPKSPGMGFGSAGVGSRL